MVCCWLVFSSGQFFALRLPADTLACLNQPDSLTAPPGVRYKCEQNIRAACECWLGERLTRLKLGSLVFRHQQLGTAQQMLIERTSAFATAAPFPPQGASILRMLAAAWPLFDFEAGLVHAVLATHRALTRLAATLLGSVIVLCRIDYKSARLDDANLLPAASVRSVVFQSG